MSSLTYKQAYDDILAALNVVVQDQGWDVFWESVRSDRSPGKNIYVVPKIRHAEAGPPTLGGVGYRMFSRTGMLMVSIYVPAGRGLSEAYAAGKLVADAYEGTSSENDVWFRNVRLSEEGLDGAFFMLNVFVDFEYYEQK